MITMIWAYICANPEQAAVAVLAIAEVVTRMTPTKKDDGFVTRAGKIVDFVFARLPNRLK